MTCLPIFLSFQWEFVSKVFSGTMQTKYIVYLRRMSVCIVGLRLGLNALILLFLSNFLSFSISHACLC